MMSDDGDDRGFRVLEGGGERRTRVGGVEVVAAAESRQPFPVEAVVQEEDTWLVLSEPHVVRPEHPVRVMTKVWEARAETPGNVVVREGKPLRLLAVVHDLDDKPTWREEWVAAALARALRIAEVRGVESLRLPVIGARHGSLEPQRFAALLGEALRRAELQTLRRVWLVLPEGVDASVLGRISDAG